MVSGILASGFGVINFFAMAIMSTGGEAYRQTAEIAAFSGIFWLSFGVVAVLVGFGLLKLKYYAWVVFEIQTGLAALIFLFYIFSGGLFLVASLGCLFLMVVAFTLRDQFRTRN
ncbi:MAG: hypothetical protein JSW11_04715 [Candidatus Heimdallarchaeota archaeon]|nr:MAG: hypothetical protein JSW11_04715 [Candidatus Heimdallarchaeota archaeon]